MLGSIDTSREKAHFEIVGACRIHAATEITMRLLPRVGRVTSAVVESRVLCKAKEMSELCSG